MKGFTAYLRKEYLEQLRGYKLLILFSVLILFGMISPLVAKITPDLLKNLSGSGITIKLPQITVSDAWAQFFKSISQIGMIVLILLFGTSLPQEINHGTLIIPLAKGLSRNTVILVKYLVSFINWTVGYVVSAVICCGYTQYLFGAFAVPRLAFSLFCLWIFGDFLLALVLFAGTITTGNYGGLLLDLVFLGLLLALNAFPKLQKWNPITLASQNASMLTRSNLWIDFTATVWITIFATVICFILSTFAFQKKKL
jgi:ABC-2 type transport system permease protein